MRAVPHFSPRAASSCGSRTDTTPSPVRESFSRENEGAITATRAPSVSIASTQSSWGRHPERSDVRQRDRARPRFGRGSVPGNLPRRERAHAARVIDGMTYEGTLPVGGHYSRHLDQGLLPVRQRQPSRQAASASPSRTWSTRPRSSQGASPQARRAASADSYRRSSSTSRSRRRGGSVVCNGFSTVTPTPTPPNVKLSFRLLPPPWPHAFLFWKEALIP